LEFLSLVINLPSSPDAAGRALVRARVAIAAMTIAGFALTMLVFFPGYMTNDATFVYGFMRTGQYGDWQSPLMSMLWGLIDPLAPGPASMFTLIAILYWLAFGMLALTVACRSTTLSIVVPLLALVPSAFMLLGMIWRDILFAVIWLLAAVTVYAAADRPASRQWPALTLALILLAVGVLLRPNSIVAAPLLLGYLLWPRSFDWKRAALLFLPALAAGYGLVHLVYYGVLDVKREHPLHSVVVFDLGGITHFTGENQFPVSWSAREASLIARECYSPERWDTYWTTEPCRFVMQRLERADDAVFGTPRLAEAWLRAVAAHPLAYLQHRATVFWTFLGGSNLTLELYDVDDPIRASLTQRPAFRALVVVHERLQPTLFFRVGSWLFLAAVILAITWRRRATVPGAFAVGITSSAIVYVLTFAPVGVSSDFRYAYWCVLAALAGVVPALLAGRERLSAP
jgi:hypothetical protein